MMPPSRFVAAILAAAAVCAQPSVLEQAAALYQRTEYSRSLDVLKGAPPADPQVLLLTGKNWFYLGDFKKATEALEKAAQAGPRSSTIQHWLARAWGRRAETSSVFTAPGYAGRCRRAFERAVELDPNNVEAMNDLLEYYLEAPGIMGGGIDKAEALAEKIGAKDPVEKHYALSRIAAKRKDYAKAEQHLRQALEMQPNEMGRILDLAKFLAQRGKTNESETLFDRAEKLDARHPKLLFTRAQVYIDGKRHPDRARDLLNRYLAAPLTPDDPPREGARRLLARLGGA